MLRGRKQEVLYPTIVRVFLFAYRFSKDPEIIKTVYQKYGQTIETPPTIKGENFFIIAFFPF